MDFNLRIDPQYIVLVILVTETIVKYFGSNIKDKSWVALAVATVIGIVDFIMNWSTLEGAGQKYDFVYSVAINYTIATSFYELILKKVKKIIGEKLANGTKISAVSSKNGKGMQPVSEGILSSDFREEAKKVGENKPERDVRSLIEKYTKRDK